MATVALGIPNETPAMPEPHVCSACGAPIRPGAPAGQCPRCLFGLGLDLDQPEPQSSVTGNGPQPKHAFPGFHVISRLGEGACGEVFKALQERPVRREVAVKVLKPGMDSRMVLARFEAERQVLAMMSHPNIARVFDAGADSGGHPFFVMEYIDGENIVTWCERRALPVSRRLDLFLQICEGMRHAHLRGVIHRDLKPSNILVTEVDGRPVPKIIDFGVAKCMDHQQLGNRTLYTVFDQFVGTPAYMSPEQAGLTGEGIDTRSDIYSLGVLLYELLAGSPPFDPGRLRRAAIDEICRIIRVEDPPPPSARVTHKGTGASATVAARKLSRELRGDLDGIVMKALEKSPDQRYDSITVMADDIRRHLNDEPVLAQAPGNIRRVWKFVKRNKVSVVSGSLVLVALVAGLTTSLWMAHKEKRARMEMELRAYFGDMNLAARICQQENTGYAGVLSLLDTWKSRRPDLCSWEWSYLHSVCHQEETVIQVSDQKAKAVSWSPDGLHLVAAGLDGTATVWDFTASRKTSTWRDNPPAPVLCAEWLKRENLIALAGDSGKIVLWNPSDDGQRVLPGHDAAVFALSASPDGRLLASGGADDSVRVWDLASGTEIARLGVRDVIWTLCWSPGSDRLFCFGSKNLGVAWDAAAFKVVWELPRLDQGTAGSAACSPDGETLAVGMSDGAIYLRDAATGARLNAFWDNLDQCLSIAWSPDGRYFAGGGRGSGRIVVRDLLAGGTKVNEFRGHAGSVHALGWRPRDERLASAGADGTVRIWNLSEHAKRAVTSIKSPAFGLFLKWSPDGSRLACGGPRLEAWYFDTKLDLAPVALENGYHNWTRFADWSPDGRLLVTCGTGGVRLWNAETRSLLWNFKCPGQDFQQAHWKPGGDMIAAIGWAGKLVLLDPSDGEEIDSVVSTEAPYRVVAWNPDGSTLAVSSGDAVLFYDEKLRRLAHSCLASEMVVSLAWSPSGALLATGSKDGAIRLWNPDNGTLVRVLAGHGDSVSGLAWSPDGSRIASGGSDRVVRIWDPSTGCEIISISNPGESIEKILSVAWHPDGKRIAVTDTEGYIVILDSGPSPGNSTPPAAARAENIRFLRSWCEITEAHAEGDADALRRLGWVRATSPYPEVRDGAKAVRQADEANRLTGGINPGVLTILAAAHAEAGDFTNAIDVQRRALDLSTNTEARASRMAVLRLYEQHIPYRDGVQK